MNNRLQAQIQDTRFAPINRLAQWGMCVMTSVFLLAFLFVPKSTYAACWGSANVSPTGGAAICGSGTATLTLTGVTGGATGTNWTANYQWQTSPDGSTGWTNITGAAGTISSPSPTTATYTTPVLTAGTSCSYAYYRVVLSGITGPCVPGTTSFITNVVSVALCPSAGTITGPSRVCNGDSACFTETVPGGTWSSSNAGIFNINPVTGCGLALSTTNVTIIYTPPTGGSCVATKVITAAYGGGVINGKHYLCPGVSNALFQTGGGTSGAIWSSTNTSVALVGSSSGVVSPVSTTPGDTATIVYTQTGPLGGCYATFIVTIAPLPAAITGNAPICDGATLTLSDASAPGTWLSSNSACAAMAPTGVVTGHNVTGSPCNSIITFTQTLTGCTTTTEVTVNPAPTITGYPGPICSGGSYTLTGTPSGGTWTSGAATVATVGSSSGVVTGTLTGTSPGTAVITYTAPGIGCKATITVSINPIPGAITGNPLLCVGGTTTLNSPTPGSTWASSNISVATIGSSSGIVNGVTVGTSTISYTVTATGCSSPSVVVTVNPALAAITGTMLLCPGQCATLTDATPGGTWSSGTTSVAAIGSSTGVVCGIAAGTSLISYTLTASTGCRATAAVTVNSSTPPITPGTPTMCVGNCTTLANSTPSGTWSSSNPVIATVDTLTGVVCGASAGTATITYLLPTGCRATTVVTINALPPAIGGTLSVCVGSTTSLTDITTGGTWVSSVPFIATIGSASGVVTGSNPGTTTITYTLPTGCSITAVVTVYAVPAAITGTPTVCQGSTTALGSTTPGGTWTSSAPPTASVSLTTGVVTGNLPGTATITYTTTGGCYVTAVVTVSPLPAAITGATFACIGSCTTLSNTTPGGSWISGNTAVATIGSSTGVACGVTNGTSTITYMMPSDCYVTTVVTVSNAPSPIGGTLSACVGGTSALTHATPGGVWSSSNLAVGTISTGGVVSALSAGTTIISYVLPSGCFATAIFTVNAPPAAIVGTGTVCAGSTLTLTDVTPGGTWTSSNTAVATVGFSTGIVTGVPPGGTATITYTITSTGCFTTTVVTVNPSPAAISGTTFTMCVGSCITLSNTTPGGTWTSSNTAIANVGSSTGIVCGVTNGIPNITYTAPGGCRAYATVTVLPLPAAITGSLLLCPGTSTSLSSTTPGGTWSICGGTGVALVGATTGVVTGISGPTVVICYTTGAGCFTSTTVTINDLPATITGGLSICIGGTTSLSSTTPGGTWSSSNLSVATVVSSTGVVSGLTTGTSRITYTAPLTGCYVTADVTVNPAPPAITGPGAVCVGATITLGDAAAGGTWSISPTAIATIGSSTGIVTGIAPGTATVVYDVSAGCSTSRVITVNLTPAAISGSVPVCMGSTITLSTTTPGGTWSSVTTAVATIGSTSGVVTPVSGGTSVISYIMPTGCFATTEVTVNSLPLPITGTGTICQADSLTLSNATAGGGTWSSTDLTVAVGSATGVVIGAGAGTATITFTATTTGCYTTTVVTINPIPAPITGPTNVCELSTITLSDATPGGIWNSSLPTTANINASTGEVLGVSGGTVIITYTLGTGCFITRGLTVDPLPLAITGSLSGCVGVPVTLSDPTPGGSWSISPSFIATITSGGVVTGLAEGTATVTYTMPTGCFITAVFTVNPAPEPIAGTAIVCVGSCSTLTDATPGGTWSSANTLIATVGSSTGVACGISAGTVTITYTAATGCYITRVFTVYPIPPAYTGTMVVCQGQTTTLSDIITGGTWTSSVPTTATVGSASGIVTGVLGYGTATITYTLPTGCYVTDVVTVNPLPATITGDFQICNLTSTTLSSATPGGVWSSSDPFVASIDSFTGVVDAHVAGVTTITYTLTATGCYVATTFIVDPLPDTIAGTRVVCVGQTTVLSNAMGSGTWISQFPSIATIGFTTGIVTGISAGTTTITFTLPTGCDTTIVVTVNPLPDTIVGPSAICIGNTVTYTDATPGGTWSSTSGTISIGSATGIVTGLSAGTARITYTLSATGCRITKVITINPNPTAIKGFTAMCLGNTTTLFDSTHGGTWVSADTTIVKIISTTSSGDSIVVKGMAVGLTTITYTLPTGCFITALVTVHALPANIGGPSAVCAGSTITLTDSIAGGTWSVTPTAVATIVSTTGVLSGVTAGTAIVTYTNGQGCIKTKVITVNPLPAPISGPTDVCVGSTILLHDATPGGTWSTTDTLIATIDTGLVSGISMGDALITYTLTATGCAVTAIVHVRPLPNVTVNHPDILCRHASVLLSADGAGPLATYVWNPAVPTLSCDTCQETVASPSVTTTYTVTGYTSFGCKDTAMVTVVVDSILNNIHITGKDSICAGTCTTLYAEGFPPGSLFAWHPVSGLSCTICDTVVACPDATRTYFAIAIDSIGCKDSASITVHIMPLPVLDYLPRPAFVCKGDSTQLNAFSSVFGTTFAWFPNIFLTCDSCKDPIAYDTMNLVYRVIGTTPFGCYDSIRVPVSVLENSINTINADTAICTGKSVQIQANAWSADGSDAEYLWIPSTGLSNAHIRNPLATPAVTTTYSLVITPNACFSDTLQFTVLVAPYPDLSITPPNSTVVAGTMVPMVATVNNGVIITSYAWSPSNTLSCEACYNTIATPTVNTTYTFSAESNYGCASSTSATINIFCDNSQVFIPNTFTPNGDGMNDRFYISAKGINEITRFSIYNRWGELVYDAHNISPNNAAQGWDGTYKGLVQAPDVFIVIVDAICELGAPFHYKADVSIVR